MKKKKNFIKFVLQKKNVKKYLNLLKKNQKRKI